MCDSPKMLNLVWLVQGIYTLHSITLYKSMLLIDSLVLLEFPVARPRDLYHTSSSFVMLV